MLAHLLPAICASVFGAAGCQQDQPTGVHAARAQADVAQSRDTTLAPAADTYIRQGSPNQNQGAELILRLQSSGKNRALLRWDQQALVQAQAGGTVTSARLELTIADLGDNWSSAGRTIELHRMTQAWTELGATWNCAVDSVPGNSQPDCAGPTAWEMDPGGANPWVAAPTATALLKNGQTGVVTFDVTADVVAWLAGQPNDGWILKKTVEGDPGKVDFGSRESATPPGLLLSVAVADTSRPPIPRSTTYTYPHDTLYVVTNPADTGRIYYRRLYEIMFADSASGLSIRGLLAKYHAQIVDGVWSSGSYIVMMPDPGATWQAVQARRDSLHREPIVVAFMPLIRRDNPPVPRSRFPVDGVEHARSNWFDGSLDSRRRAAAHRAATTGRFAL